GFCWLSAPFSQNRYTVYFVAEFDHAFTSSGTWKGAAVTAGSTSSTGTQSGAYVTFDTTVNPIVKVKVGISYVSIANAQANLNSENSAWDFAGIKTAANDIWNQKLNAIQVTGGTTDQKKIFYTALYHSLIHPNLFSDVNGQYMGFDNVVHNLSPG